MGNFTLRKTHRTWLHQEGWLLTKPDNAKQIQYPRVESLEIVGMFGSANSKEKLQEKYNKLMQESYDLSTVNRKKSDLKRAEAEEVGKQLDELEKK